jgi:formate dehydrogenase major subunit
MLKAWYGDAATERNDFAYHYLPKRDDKKNYSISHYLKPCTKANRWMVVNGSILLSVVQMPIRNKKPDQIEMLVSIDLWLNETADF